jgi:peptide/nickel transport system ATP-binding protein/oligopeptide transport system ATP-binding protein
MKPAPLLEVSDLRKYYPTKKKGLFQRRSDPVQAVDGVSFELGVGETVGLVGESGCGKTTVGRTILRLIEPTSGTIKLLGKDISLLPESAVRPHRRDMQIVFQDPYSSLNPRMTAGDIVAEPLLIHQVGTPTERRERVASLFERVGLPSDSLTKYPHEFSGGQRQRIGIAKALALNPKLIVCDEPVSALDVSIQAQVINLLIDLQKEFGLSYLFIAHDLAVVEYISHRVIVMYLGQIVEHAGRDDLFRRPLHPYTQALLSAAPLPDPDADRSKRIILAGDVPSPIRPPAGCRFHTRCPFAGPRCREEAPELREVEPAHWAACHLHDGGVALS